MKVRDYYYGPDQCSTAGIKPFVDHAKKYVSRERFLPHTKTSSIFKKDVIFTFVDELMLVFVKDLPKIKKPYEVATKYGFRGFSTGKKNGIFYQRKEDKGLIKATEALIQKHKSIICEDLDIDFDEFESLKKVKIVCHNPSGERVVGVLNEKNCRIIFIGFAHY